MLEVKLLKVTHAGKKEARKLIPYIQEADIYSPEHAGSTNEMALAMEHDWQRVLSSGGSRKHFQKVTEFGLQHLPPNQQDYAVSEKVYLFRNEVPIFYLERFTPAEAMKLFGIKQQVDEKFERSLEVLAQGNVDRFLEIYWDSLQLESQTTGIRDKEIATNLEKATSYLSEKFPALASRGKINLVALLGALHNPERYTSMEVEVVDLRKTITSIPDRLDDGLGRQLSFDEMRDIMLAYGALELSLRRVIGLNRYDLERIDPADLVAELKKNAR
ncbi:hypothetical protein HQ489_05505 [Candidatus Woesearchaeota archaeon]|nr:hypothetical protein [Candidatus Woesearchaeota archaeon]